MKNPLLTSLLLCGLTTALADVTKGEFGAHAAQPATIDSKSPPATEGPKQTKRNSYPFHGTLASIDSSGKRLSLAGKEKSRVILITAETRFFRDGKKVKLGDALAGERVTGAVRKNSAGQEEALTVRYGGAPPRK
jgi:hypothetical protein